MEYYLVVIARYIHYFLLLSQLPKIAKLITLFLCQGKFHHRPASLFYFVGIIN